MALFLNNIFLTLSFLSMKIEIPLIDIFGNYNGKILGTIFSFRSGISNEMSRSNIDTNENTMWIVLINSAQYQPQDVLNKFLISNISAIIITDTRNHVDVVMEYRRYKSNVPVFFMEYPYFRLITNFLQRNINFKRNQSLGRNKKLNDHTILNKVLSTTTMPNRREKLDYNAKEHNKGKKKILNPNSVEINSQIFFEKSEPYSFIDFKAGEKIFKPEKKKLEGTKITTQENDYLNLSNKNNDFRKFNNLYFTKNQDIDILKGIHKNSFIERENKKYRNTCDTVAANTLIRANDFVLAENKVNLNNNDTRISRQPEMIFETAIENKHDFNPTPFFVQLFLQIPPVLTILILVLLWRTFSVPEDQSMDIQYIETLPLITYKHENSKNMAFNDNTICCICLEPYIQGDQIRCLYCHHIFHKICVDPWLCRTCICPICRKSIFLTESDPFFL
ncbi:hypothetical protein LUQ84_000050 [Hamiltosporidium tvaerminnensis]|nr:hypothetical protein LUQ84_000050 [Hamiltosporidium tvaerminnensis]